MIPSNRISSSQPIPPQRDEALADDASATAARTNASSAAVSRSAAAGSSAPVPVVHRVPLHAFGRGTPAVSASVSTSSSAPAARPIVTPSNDVLGVIASYLPQRDQLMMRSMNTTMHRVVDPAIHTLKLSGRQACAALSQPNALRNLDELYLTDCTDQELIDVAALLAKLPTTDLDLIVKGNSSRGYLTAASIAPLANLHLSGLTLIDVRMVPAMSRALEHSKSLLSIKLLSAHMLEHYRFPISQLPKLHSLSVRYWAGMTPATFEALGSHRALETLNISSAAESDVRALAASASIRTLSIGGIHNGEMAALRALADNKVLTSLTVDVDDADALRALSPNATIQALNIGVPDVPKSLLGSLSAMTALTSFHMGRSHFHHVVLIEGDDIQALCAKPLKFLSISAMALDGAARAHLATSQTASLRLQSCTAFETEDFAALSQNRSITSLLIMSAFSKPGNNHEAVLSMVKNGLPQLESLTIDVGSETPADAKAAIEAAWTASGRLLANLSLAVRHV